MRLFLFVLLMLGASAASAGDGVRTGPAPSWVVPVDAPAPAADAGGVAMRLLDFQTRLDGAGLHQFAHQIVKVSSPAALQAAGNVVVAWQPTYGQATVHKVAIRRAGRVIDVLNGGQAFSIIRRETGLESAHIDGVLTAVMQVPDLRVDDEIELSFTIDSNNPVLQGRQETGNLLVGGATLDRLHVRLSWPVGRDVRWRVGDGLPKPRKSIADGMTLLTIDAANFKTPIIPAQAPGRYVDSGLIQVSDFADWRSIADLMTPLYAKASTLAPGSAVMDEVRRIAAASADPKMRAAAILQLVQSQVRYFANVEGLGGYVPNTADEVWSSRTGDCKGKTVLLLAMLHALDIEAVPALVSATRGDGVDRSLPMPGRFDHVLVRATIAGKLYWLDGTRMGDRDLDRLAVPAFEWSLPLTADSKAPVAMVATEPTLPRREWRLDLDARAGLTVPAKATGEGIFRGDAGAAIRVAASLMSVKDRDAWLRKVWRERHDWVTVDSVSYRTDDVTGEVRIGFVGSGTMDWNMSGAAAANRYEANKARLGHDIAPEREAALADSAPVVVGEEYDVTHQVILLPDHGKGFYLEGDPIDQTSGGIHYRRTQSLKDGRFEMEASTRGKTQEISFAAAKAADTETDKIFARQLFVHMPYDYASSATVRASAAAAPAAPDGMAAYAEVFALVQARKPDAALASLDKLIAAGTRNAQSLSLRGGLLGELGRYDEANVALDAALALDSRNPSAISAKVRLLLQLGRSEDALILLDRLVLLVPDSAASYEQRGEVRADSGQFDGALADLAIVIEKQPDNQRARSGRVRIFNTLGERDKALAESDAFVKLLPDSAVAHSLRGSALARLGRGQEASQELGRSLAIAPSADAYIIRLAFDLSGDDKAKLADMLASIRLAPERSLPSRPLARVVADAAALAQLTIAYDAAIAKDKAKAEQLGMLRDAVFAAAGHPEALLARYDRAVAEKPEDPFIRNTACWFRATHKLQLDKALADCDVAIRIRHEAAFLDSRGLVQLQRGEYAKAIADYDAAVALRPYQAGSLFGRGVAKARAGDSKGSAADLAAARKASDRTEGEYADYGIKP